LKHKYIFITKGERKGRKKPERERRAREREREADSSRHFLIR